MTRTGFTAEERLPIGQVIKYLTLLKRGTASALRRIFNDEKHEE